jgi:hypothetical protein
MIRAFRNKKRGVSGWWKESARKWFESFRWLVDDVMKNHSEQELVDLANYYETADPMHPAAFVLKSVREEMDKKGAPDGPSRTRRTSTSVETSHHPTLI